jgi:hypothetical protein
MTDTSLRQLYAAIAAGPLKSCGLRAFDYVPATSEWPAAYCMPPEITYEGITSTSHLELTIDIVLLVSAVVDKHQLNLLDYMDDQGPLSIPLAFHNDPSLGLQGVNAYVMLARPLNYEEQAGFNAFGALFETRARLS